MKSVSHFVIDQRVMVAYWSACPWWLAKRQAKLPASTGIQQLSDLRQLFHCCDYQNSCGEGEVDLGAHGLRDLSP